MYAFAELRDDYAAGKEWLLGTAMPVNRHERRGVQAQRKKTAVRSEVDQARDTARRIGTVVWTATDPDDIADILDAEANDLPSAQLARRVSATLYAGRFVRVADPQTFLRSVCARVPEDGSVVTELLEGLRIGAVIAGLFRKHAKATTVVTTGSAGWDAADLHTAPVPLLNAVLAHARSTACLAALVDLVLSDRPRPPRWLAESVARGWVDGERSLVRLLSMMYDDADVPEDLLPPDQRLRRDQIILEHNEGEGVFEEFIARTAALQ